MGELSHVKSFSELISLYVDTEVYVSGKWYLLPEREILNDRNKQFSNKTKERPVVLVRISGPNAIIFPRSASVGGGFKHSAHEHSDIRCPINKDGFVQLDCPCTVNSRTLSGYTFSCFEPEESPLMAELAKEGAK